MRLGDRLLGAGRVEPALAEYQVALRRGGNDPEVLVRLAHGYAKLDRFDDASEFYGRLLREDSAYRDQAIADFLQMARRAVARGDRARMARALEQVQAIRPGAIPDDLVRPLGDHYYVLADHERALPLLLTAHGEATGLEARQLTYQIARTYDALGDCRQALAYFERFLATGVRGEAAREARWHAGGCAYRLAQERRSVGRPGEALRLLDRVIEFQAPPAILDEAWFDRGEVLYSLGRYDEALLAYRQVLELNPSRTGRLVRHAEDRIRAIRFRP